VKSWEAQLNDFSDEILVEASRRGDRSAYALLVKRHFRYVYAVCLGVLGNVHDAEDIAQDAMLKGWVKLSRLDKSDRYDKWILRIAKNLCVDFLRRKKSARAFFAEKAALGGYKCGDNYDLARAVARLPQEIRLPLVMYYFDNKDAKAIAEKLEISHSTACQRIRTARKQLHRLLTEGADDG